MKACSQTSSWEWLEAPVWEESVWVACKPVFWLINVWDDVGGDVMDAGVSLSELQVPIWPINWQQPDDKNVLTLSDWDGAGLEDEEIPGQG